MARSAGDIRLRAAITGYSFISGTNYINTKLVAFFSYCFMSLTKKITFINIASYPAVALLPNGNNVHINIQSYYWWLERLMKCAE